ncbi:MAG: SPOR domain-containing protein [Rhodoferax sp.]|nr:SPOR domain-containing protein [Rhodoferax sp.]
MKSQRGGTILGFILGLLVGLGIALGVTVYITKVPLPFMTKGQTRGAEQNDAESKKNKDWDPNALLAGKPAVKAPAAETPAADSPPPLSSTPPAAPATPTAPPPAPPKTEDKAAASSDPLGALAKAKSGSAEAPQISYYVQVGAFRTPEDAQAQRAKLALTGVDAKVTEREQGGRPLFRVRVGPFEKIEEAERAKEKLDKAGNETALVKVQR